MVFTLPNQIRSQFLSVATSSVPVLIGLFAVFMQLSDLLFAGYPTIFKSSVVEKYDFIVVGAGSAGSALAARLSSDPRVTVLLLEAGGNPSPLTLVPAATPYLHHPSVEWPYTTVPQTGSAIGSENNTVLWGRGRGLGGSSNLNFMVYNRGNPNDYDRWAQITGDVRWGWENVEKYFLGLEDYYGNWQESGYHRKGGPLRVEPGRFTTGVRYILGAAEELGYPIRDANQNQIPGFSPLDFTQKSGTRFSVYNAFIEPIESLRKNLIIRRYSKVTKIHFDNDLRAVGVTYFRHEVKMLAEARREIVISCGAIASPQLLMLSGIGPKQHLLELGIRPLLDLPVGDNLEDHVITMIGPFTINRQESFIPERDMTLSRVLEYFTEGSGPLSVPLAITTCGFISTPYSPSPSTWPDIFWVTHSHGISSAFPSSMDANYNSGHTKLFERWLAPILGQDAHFIHQILGLPRSVGYLRLANANPDSLPLINPRYYSDELNQDMEAMIAGIELGIKLYENTTTLGGKLGARLFPEKLPGCEQFVHRSKSYWECFVRTLTSTLYHPAGTCSMGKPGSGKTVVDSKCRVLGTKGLRVADSSIMPKVTNANTNGPAIIVGEICADMIKETWGLMK